MKVLVCGGRDFRDWPGVEATLSHLGPIDALCHGGASGADTLAGHWASLNGVPCTVYRADWKQHGRAAGPIRNAHMLADFKPDRVVAFTGGRGTADMVAKATVAGVVVVDMRGGAV
jgi:formate dehydrogenase assembly factor FdhD